MLRCPIFLDKNTLDTADLVTKAEAARLLGVTPTRIQALVKKGKLTTRPDARGKEKIERHSLQERLNTLHSAESVTSSTTVSMLLRAVQEFHQVNHFQVNTGARQDLLLRLALLQEELGELASVVTKSPPGAEHGFEVVDWEHLKEEWTDILYLLLGWAVEIGWSAEEVGAMFQRVHHKNMSRAPRHTALASQDH